jgi:hypothetical protein
MATLQSEERPEASGEKHDDRLIDLVRPLVGRFRERTPEGLRGILGNLLAERDCSLNKHISDIGFENLRHYDELMLTALSMRYDALDFAVSISGFAIAEIDGEGRISYANGALKKVLPGRSGWTLRRCSVSVPTTSGKRFRLVSARRCASILSGGTHTRFTLGARSAL